MRRPALALLLALPLAIGPGVARAGDPRESPLLWATVNVCDTERHPDTIGVRASMPGSGRRGETMWMRFRVQYLSAADGRWHNFTLPGADSGDVRVGRHARYRVRQSGYLFPFAPAPGERYRLRGSVEFQWRRRGKAVRRVREVTSAGHRPAVADPEGHSEATCDVVG
ncbi:MAG TPA: hypothetical protein VGW75_03000 [Solirubrobacteraceae bacterium]|nr:hypothetical protein [Solirubrobacteraceae bacterium]